MNYAAAVRVSVGVGLLGHLLLHSHERAQVRADMGLSHYVPARFG